MSSTAILYRMSTEEHICPFGLKSKDLLKRKGFNVKDHKLTSRKEIDAFKQKYHVETTPQTFIKQQRVGGYDELREYFDMEKPGQSGISYTPVISIFAIAFLMAFALRWQETNALTNLFSINLIVAFVAISMSILAVQKLKDLYSFTNSFITYDLLAMRQVRYAYFYPFAEAFVGLGMLAGFSGLLIGPISLFIGTIGAVSVFKAVYIDKRELKCACVGGDTNVPLGFVSLTENLFMIAAGTWMLLTAL